MKTIIVPVDFSETSENAASYAAQLSLVIHADIFLLHVYQYPVMLGDVPYPAEAYAYIADDAEESMNALAEKLGTQLNGRRVVKTELREGSFIRHLRDFCEENDPDLVVMGCSGISAAGKFLFGSNALQAIRHLSCPVLLIPPGARYSGIQQPGLLADSINDGSSVAVRTAIRFVNALHATLTVAHINTGADQYKHDSPEAGRMKDLFSPTPVTFLEIQSESFEEGAAKFAETRGLDLLVIVPFRHSFFGRLFHSPHTEQLLKHPAIPTLFLKAPETK